jgi:signal transduction histidine kinase
VTPASDTAAPQTGSLDDRTLAVFFAITGAAMPLLYPVARWAFPNDADPLGMRLLLALVAVAGLAAQRSPAWRPSAPLVAEALLALTQLWFLALGYVNGVSAPRLLNALLLVAVGGAVFRDLRGLVVFVLVSMAAAAVGHLGPAPDAVPTGLAVAMVGVMGLVMGVVVRLREALAERVGVLDVQTLELAAEVDRRCQAEEAALAASRAKSLFLAHMSEELRAPLNEIVGRTEMVHATSPDATRAELDQVLDAARNLRGMIDEVLDLARVESGRLQLTAEPFDVAELLDTTVDMVAPAAEALGLTFVYRPEAVCVLADRDRTRQIVMNLLTNAVRFTPQGGRIGLEVAIGAQRVEIAVTDSGLGFRTEELERLFLPFQSLQEPGGRETGLGLALGRQLAEHMGGTLTAASVVGDGSRFVLSLPCVV